MATIPQHDEKLAESNEFFYLNSNIIDNEPFYNNFTTIANLLRHSNKPNQLNTSNKTYRTSRIINGYIFNLIQIIEDIGYNPDSLFLYSSRTKTNQSLLYIISKLGGAYGPLVNIRRSNLDKQYFQKWYLDRYQRSASMIRINHMSQKTTQISDYNRSNINIFPTVSTKLISKQMEEEEDEKQFQNRIQRMYGFDDVETISSVSSRRSSIDEKTPPSTQQPSPTMLQTIDNYKPKQQITIREFYPRKEIPSVMVHRSSSPSISSQQTNDNYEYEQLLQNHPELYNDPNPEIIRKPNPEQVTYKQNVFVRYLVPPTPPPPGPLIIREILPPRQPSPPPLIIKQQDPSPPTPPPLILREAPPPPPPYQEAQVITKVVSQETSSPQRVVVEHNPPLPQKPQSIIIEKWLPYKPAPPREIIYERVTEAPVVSEFEPSSTTTNRQRRHSAEFHSESSSRLPIPVHIDRQNSFDHFQTQQSSVFNQFARSTHQQLESMQRQTLARMQEHQRWITNQHQQHMNMFMQSPLQLTTPTLIVNHPPVTRTVTSYARNEQVQQQVIHQPAFLYSS